MHAHESYCSQFVCLSVCVCVCPHSSASLGRVCNKLNLLARSLLYSKGFQVTDFVKKLSFSSYTCSSFGIAKQLAICIYMYARRGCVCSLECSTQSCTRQSIDS